MPQAQQHLHRTVSHHSAWASLALAISTDETNPSAITYELRRMLDQMVTEELTIEQRSRHPAVRLIVAKLADLCDITMKWPAAAEAECILLSQQQPPSQDAAHG